MIDNHSRSATKHEGPGAHHGKIKNAATEHNLDAADGIDAALQTKTMINNVINTAGRFGITDPERLRMLARDQGLLLHWSKDRATGNVSGVQWQIVGGLKLSGREAGFSLGDLERNMGWSEAPPYKRTIATQGESFDAYRQILTQHGKGHMAGRGASILDQVIKRQIEAKTAAVAAAQAVQGEHQRPKRASKNSNSLNSRNTRQEPKQMNPADIKALMATLTKLPQESATPTKLRPPSQQDIDSLTQEEKVFLIDSYDARQPDFQTPARDAARRVTLARENLDKLRRSEPWPLSESAKRLFRKPIKRETALHLAWSAKVAEAQVKFDQLHEKVAKMLREKVYSDPALFAMVPEFHREQADQAAQQAKAKKDKDDAERKAFRQKMGEESARGERQASKKSSIRERPC